MDLFRFVGGPYDGAEYTADEVGRVAYPLWGGRDGSRTFLMMAPLDLARRVLAGAASLTAEGAGQPLHPYEQVRTEGGFEYRDAVVDGSFADAMCGRGTARSA